MFNKEAFRHASCLTLCKTQFEVSNVLYCLSIYPGFPHKQKLPQMYLEPFIITGLFRILKEIVTQKPMYLSSMEHKGRNV